MVIKKKLADRHAIVPLRDGSLNQASLCSGACSHVIPGPSGRRIVCFGSVFKADATDFLFVFAKSVLRLVYTNICFGDGLHYHRLYSM